ncbi:DUF4297 domain-containing protein [Streptomyces sp. KD18]|nr:DUF4297 domain-containing protein [Streptomyces sp. KD18]
MVRATGGFVSGRRDISDLAKLLISELAEDSDSDTASRYNFQYQCAARHCFAMLNDSQLSAIICEWHVDYILGYRDGTYELVSVKHREPSLGPWSFSDLWNRGDLAMLFERWKSTPESSCRLVTNGALKPTQGDALSFATALTRKSADSWITDVAKRLSCGEQQAKSFLLNLRIEHGIPDRVTLRSHEILTTVEKSLEDAQIGVAPSGAWDSIVALVAFKSRDLDNRDLSSIDLASPVAWSQPASQVGLCDPRVNHQQGRPLLRVLPGQGSPAARLCMPSGAVCAGSNPAGGTSQEVPDRPRHQRNAEDGVFAMCAWTSWGISWTRPRLPSRS